LRTLIYFLKYLISFLISAILSKKTIVLTSFSELSKIYFIIIVSLLSSFSSSMFCYKS